MCNLLPFGSVWISVIAFGLVYCNAVTLDWFDMCTFWTLCTMFVNWICPGKSLKTSFVSPGKPWNLVFASPGKSWKTVFYCLYEPCLDRRRFLSTTVQYLQTKLPLTNGTLRDLQCLQPTARSMPESESCIQLRLAKKLPQVILQDEVSVVTDEWKVYSVDDIPRSWYCVISDVAL